MILSSSSALRRAALTFACGLVLAAAPPTWAADAEPSLPYATRKSDTVIGLSRRLLVDPAQWREVAQFNRLQNPNRIPTGVILRIPTRLLRSEAAPARVEQVVGEVRASGTVVKGGEALPEGATLTSGGDGSAVVHLADGSLLRLAVGSTLQVERARRYPGLEHVDSGVKLDAGRIEVRAAKVQAGKPGFEVRTPQGVLGVRGTEYRVAVQGGERPSTRGEVLEGAVQFSAGNEGRRLGAGFGSVIDDQRRVTEPTPLLAAPDLAALPALQERLVLRFPVPGLDGARSFRGQVARDAQIREVVADNLAEGRELRFTNLDDGAYFLRVRGIDARGFEGRDATLAFRLKARPEPPLPAAPAPRGVTRGTRVELSWAANPEAQSYRLQVAADERFTRLVRELPALAGTEHALEGIAPGDYFWRLASVRAGNDQGPWGAARAFTLRPPPPTPAPPKIGDDSLSFAWEAEPGQTFELQLARDARFTDLVLERKLDQPTLELARPAGGVYYLRIRARDADGFQGPYTTPQRFEIIDCVKASDGACMQTQSGPVRR